MSPHSRSDVCLKMLSIALFVCPCGLVAFCMWIMRVTDISIFRFQLPNWLWKSSICQLFYTRRYAKSYDLSVLVYCNIWLKCFWNCLHLIQRSNLCALLRFRINILERGCRRWSKGGRNTWNTCEERIGTRTVLFCRSWGFAMCPSTKLLTTRAKQSPRPNLRRARARARARRERWRRRSDE